MLDDENDPAVISELSGLAEGLNSWLGEPLDLESLQMLHDFIEEHRINARRRGVNFPALTALVIPRLGWIKIVRLELNEVNIRRAVIGLLRECPNVSREEIAKAVKRAWPNRSLTSIIDEAEFKLVGV